MISELEQCSCGILFSVPIVHDSALREHFDDGTHERALTMSTCGPCFIGLCFGCDKGRGGRAWQCKCDHKMPFSEQTGLEPNTRVDEVRLDWSNFLSLHAPRERRAS